MNRLSRSVLFYMVGVSLVFANRVPVARNGHGISAGDIVREINLARQNPARYAMYVEELRSHLNCSLLVSPEVVNWRMFEGLRAIDEAAGFLRTIRPEQSLTFSPGLCRAAADHCADQAAGRKGHRGSDNSSPDTRLSRYGVWSGVWGENIAYGKISAREIVLALIIDDGQPARSHRKNIFNPSFHYAGAAYGPHALYGNICTIDFASGFVERATKIPSGRRF